MSGETPPTNNERLSLNGMLRKASFALTGLIVLCGVTGIGAAWMQSTALQRQTDAAALYANHAEADMMHDAIRSDVLARFEAAAPGSGIKREEVLADFASHIASLREHIALETRYKGSKEVSAVTAELHAPLEAYTRSADQMIRQIDANPANAKSMLPAFFAQFRNLEVSMGNASDVISVHANEASTSARRIGTVAIILLIVTMILCLAGVGAFVRLASRRVIQPIAALAGTMRQFSTGNLAIDVQGAERGDELGDMAKAMLAFRDQLRAAEASKDAQAQLIVESVGAGLTQLSHGNLAAEVTADLQAPFALLKQNFNSTVASLRGLIRSVSDSAATIHTGSEEIANASEDLARRTEGNAASLEETSAAIAQMDQRLHMTATAAGQTLERAGGARTSVASGRDVADEAVQAMQRVSESAKGIDGVIEGLDKIAFQTRVLAMNAAVEAGRAIEAGKGFAVVADLVSALAMRAEEEAGRARGQLTATQADIGIAVGRVQRVDEALLHIFNDVGEVHDLLTDIAKDNQAQSTAITEISAAVGEMDQTTQQNAAMVEQTSATARSLTAEVAALVRNAAKFKEDGTASSGMAHIGRAPASNRTLLPSAHFQSPSTFHPAAVALN